MSVTTRDSVREQVVVAVHDTLREVTTITVQLGQAGDTVKVAQVTERDRFRDRAAVRDKEEKLIVRTDTVYVERRDSVLIQDSGLTPQGRRPSVQDSGVQGAEKKSNFVSSLKWICFIILGLIALIITIKVCLRRSLF